MFDSIESAIKDFKKGKPVIVVDDEQRENEGDLILPAQKATARWFNFIIKNSSGVLCAAISQEIADKLQIKRLETNNRDPNSTPFAAPIDHISNSTGASIQDRLTTLRALAELKSTSKDFRSPGHLSTLIADPTGVLKRAGHTEAAIELCKIAKLPQAALLSEVMQPNGEMTRLPNLLKFAKLHQLKIISIEQLIQIRKNEKLVTKISTANLPTEFGTFTIHVYKDPSNQLEHVALVKGKLNGIPLIRVHSSCITGDIFHSLRCDCGPQLHASLKAIEKQENGILLYLNQEGRGIGLSNKIQAYALQEKGLDTVQANLALGFKPDLRDYGVGAQILKDLGVTKMNLLTNNPRKIIGINGHGLQIIRRIPIKIKANKYNEKYLQTKEKKMGHLR